MPVRNPVANKSLTAVVQAPLGWREMLRAARNDGHRIGFVPTMGALHDGHLSLIEKLREAGATFVTVSIFVNPTQFNDPADLVAYPRSLDADVLRCEQNGVDIVFAPQAKDMLQDKSASQVLPGRLAQELEGRHRPGHFSGMATIVTKLLLLAEPEFAAFGKKDYQQLAIIRALVRELFIDTTILAGETRREPDGLALSSRNSGLSPTDRTRAAAMSRGLFAAREAFLLGVHDPSVLCSVARQPLTESFDSVDYVSLVDAKTLVQVQEPINSDAVLLAAAKIGETRLIDNVELTFP